MNNITIELCAEDRARLDRVADLLEKLSGSSGFIHFDPAALPPAPKTVEAPTSAQPKVEKPTETEQPSQEDGGDWLAPTDDDAPAVELTDLQQLIIQLANAGKQAELRKVIFKYAERVTQIPEDKYGEVYAKLKKLEG